MCSPKEREKINWQHRNNQRIGVAVADSPYGPWQRFDKPLIDVGESEEDYDCLMTSNPSVCQMADGRMLFVYKAVSKRCPLPQGGPVVHMGAAADSPLDRLPSTRGLCFTTRGSVSQQKIPIFVSDGRYRNREEDQACWQQRLFSPCTSSRYGLDWYEALC